MKRLLFFIYLIATPLLAWTQGTSIIAAGNWNNSGIWSGGNIADDISEFVNMNSSVGTVVVQDGDFYQTSNVEMAINNTLTIDGDGSLIIGASGNPQDLAGLNNTTLNIDGTLVIWGSLDLGNSAVINITGNLIVNDQIWLENEAVLNISGDVFVQGSMIAGNDTDLMVDGSLTINGDVIVDNSSLLSGTGTVIIGGICTGPDEFCQGGPLDTILPVITGCPAEIMVSQDNGRCDASVNWSEPTADDNVGIDTFESSHVPGDIFPVGTTTVTYSAKDLVGNRSDCSFTVTVNDDLVPIISACPVNIEVELTGGQCNELVNWVEPAAADNCSITSFSGSHTPGEAFPLGKTTVTYTALDLAGNESTCSFTITVNDTKAPVISSCPLDITVNLSGPDCHEAVNWIAPTATDNCSIASLDSNYSPGDVFPAGITTVIYTAIDVTGNESTCSFTVSVNDKIAPVFASCPNTVSIDEFDVVNQTASVTWDEPSATDNCSSVNISSNFNSGDRFPPGTTKIIYTATDNSGNSAVCEFEFNVEGNRAPTGENIRTEAYSGEPTEICLQVKDPDGDDLKIREVISATLNGRIEILDTNPSLCLQYTSFEDFEGEDRFTVVVCDNGSPNACAKVEVRVSVSLNLQLIIYKALTPNNDFINDEWIIENIENYPDNRVSVYDRNGGLVYSARYYNNVDVVWRGQSNQSSQQVLASGTYFYRIDLGDGYPPMKGFIELIR